MPQFSAVLLNYHFNNYYLIQFLYIYCLDLAKSRKLGRYF